MRRTSEEAAKWPSNYVAPDVVQVLTAWAASWVSADSPEWVVGIYASCELAQVARSAHMKANPGDYDYCIEPWVVEGSDRV